MITPWLNDNFDLFLVDDSKKLTRSSRVKVNYWETTWGRWLTNPLIRNPNSKIAKNFMLRFRVPFILFQEKILPMCRINNLFDVHREYSSSVPLEFKILLFRAMTISMSYPKLVTLQFIRFLSNLLKNSLFFFMTSSFFVLVKHL